MNMNKGFILLGSLFFVFSLFLFSGSSEEVDLAQEIEASQEEEINNLEVDQDSLDELEESVSSMLDELSLSESSDEEVAEGGDIDESAEESTNQEVDEEEEEEIINSLSKGEKASLVLKDTVDAINLGKSISEKMYENFAFYKTIEDWFDEDLFGGIFSKIYEGLDKTTMGKIVTGQFEDLLCANLLKVHGETPVLATEDGRLGSHVDGQRQTINNPDGSIKYLYKVTYMIDPAFDSNNKETNLSMQVYDNKNEKYYLHLDFDKTPKDPYVSLNVKNLISTPKNQPLAWYSDIKFEKVCIEFYDVDAFFSDFKYLLKGNDNKICAEIAEVEPIYLEEEQSYPDSSGTSNGGESGGEEEYKWAN